MAGAVDAVQEFYEEMERRGLGCDQPIVADGRIHRFKSAADKRADSWYVLHADGVAAGAFGNWRTGQRQVWRESRDTFTTVADRERFAREIGEAQKRRDAAIRETQAATAERARKIWERLKPADPNHAYLKAKRIGPHCARQFGSTLVVPIHDIATRKLVNLQFIAGDGTKRFLTGGQVKGAAIMLAEAGENLSTILIVEGFATGATCREARQAPVAAALFDGNLAAVARAIRKKYPRAKIVICADDDRETDGNPGVRDATEAATAVKGILAIPRKKNAPDKKCDFNDLALAEGLGAVRAQLEGAMNPIPAAFGQLASEVIESPINWRWEKRIAAGKITLIDGNPGDGKTSITIAIAAHVTTGRNFPDGSICQRGRVIFLSAEDSAGDTLVPRFRAAGADLSMVRIMPAAFQDDGEVRVLTFPDHLRLLEEAIEREKAALVVIDPLTAFLPDRIDSHKDGSIRRVLAQIGMSAERTGAAIILIRHLNKMTSETSALYRGGGSIAIIASARAAYLIGIDPNDNGPLAERRRVLASVKNNLAALQTSLAFRLIESPGDTVAHVEWIAGECSLTANDLLASRDPRKADALEEAVEFLRVELDDGAKPVLEVEQHAKAAGITRATFKRARKKLSIWSRRKGFSGQWFIGLPDDDAPEPAAPEAAVANEKSNPDAAPTPTAAPAPATPANGKISAPADGNLTFEQARAVARQCEAQGKDIADAIEKGEIF